MKKGLKTLLGLAMAAAMVVTAIPMANINAAEVKDTRQIVATATTYETYTSRSLVKLNAAFGTYDTRATSNSSKITVSSTGTTVPANARVTKVELSLSKSASSTGNIRVYVEHRGMSASKTYANKLLYTDFNSLHPSGDWVVYFVSTRTTTGIPAAATINSGTIKITWQYDL